MSLSHIEFNSPPELASDADAHQTLSSIITGEEISHVTYLGIALPNQAIDQPLFYSTYPAAWASRYLDQRYFGVDPAILMGMAGVLPFDWGSVPVGGRKGRQFFGEAKEFGLKPHGLSLPIRGALGDQALFSINSNLPDRDWEEFKKAAFGQLALFAYQFHLRVVERLGGPKIEGVALTQREREVLLWASQGKTSWETAQILNLRESSVNFYVRLAMGKLHATTRTQAVVSAFRLGLLL
jgi:DNA-binding CsgD family transcriptional regulator